MSTSVTIYYCQLTKMGLVLKAKFNQETLGHSEYSKSWLLLHEQEHVGVRIT